MREKVKKQAKLDILPVLKNKLLINILFKQNASDKPDD